MEDASGGKSVLVKILLKVEWIIETALVLLLAFMVLVVFVEVIMRYVFNSSITSAEEVSRMLFIWMVFIGVALMLIKNRHIAFDAIQTAMPGSVKKILQVITYIGIGIVSYFLTVYGYLYSEQNFEWPMAGTGIPYGYISMILPICGAAMLIVTLVKLIGLFIPGKGGK